MQKKEEKDKLKPRVTKGIKKSMSVRQSLQANDKGKRSVDKKQKNKKF